MMNTVTNPEVGDIIYDPDDMENTDKHLIWDGHEWVQGYDIFGEYGGPYLTMRELLGNPKYREEVRELAGLEAEASGVSLADTVFSEVLAMVPGDKRTQAAAEGLPKFQAAVASASASDPTLPTDRIKLAARARRALKEFLPADAAPAARQKKKGGARRTHRARRSRKAARKMSRKH